VVAGFKIAVYTGDTADYKLKVLGVYRNLPSAGAQRRKRTFFQTF
jgi:hypothetical protein